MISIPSFPCLFLYQPALVPCSNGISCKWSLRVLKLQPSNFFPTWTWEFNVFQHISEATEQYGDCTLRSDVFFGVWWLDGNIDTLISFRLLLFYKICLWFQSQQKTLKIVFGKWVTTIIFANKSHSVTEKCHLIWKVVSEYL